MAAGQRTMKQAIAGAFDGFFQKLEANTAINSLSAYPKVKASLMQHSYATGMGMMVGGGLGAYQGATDGYRDPISGAAFGAVGGALRGGAVGYAGSWGYKNLIKGGLKTAKTPAANAKAGWGLDEMD